MKEGCESDDEVYRTEWNIMNNGPSQTVVVVVDPVVVEVDPPVVVDVVARSVGRHVAQQYSNHKKRFYEWQRCIPVKQLFVVNL